MRIVHGVLVLFALTPAGAHAGPARDAGPAQPAVGAAPGCAAATSPVLRVRIGVNSSQIGDAAPTIRGIVTDTWSRHGLSIEWVTDPPSSWDGVDAWILVRHSPADRRRANALGGAMFVDGVPNGLVFVSIDASVRWLQKEQARRLKVKPEDLAVLFPQQSSVDLRVLLGHVVAHEIGHVALRTRDHGTHGLMKADYDDFDALSRPAPLPLDSRNQRLLSARLRAGAACQALNAKNQARPGRRGRDQ